MRGKRVEINPSRGERIEWSKGNVPISISSDNAAVGAPCGGDVGAEVNLVAFVGRGGGRGN